jgi:phi LC3 family holin
MDFVSRIRNKAFWLSISGFVLLMAKSFHLFEIPENYDEIVNMVLGLLTMMGILIDPTTPGITDKK